ncbi:cytoplasmic dynein 2 light intermediate chain 1 [Galleria mellonella]|uniref:Cytoplasmic dynein 2 light intermediate chain 1 n=1 Tax=Galleria mellonella TaxID=7137 RepID=A0A6J1WES9_GALME|nr:cytoplasmic dynein 2 light intermediate chain 1 [Galleria mellonella]
MLTIPEIASQEIEKQIAELSDDNSHTIFVVGSKSVGKSTLLNTFLDKTDAPRETLVLEYSFGRKSNQRQAIEKTICHVWEYGGKLDSNILNTIVATILKRGKYCFCIMIDLSKIKTIWNTLEICLQAIPKTYLDSENSSELIILCGKYDLFKNYDSDIKKFICTTLRSVALIYNAHLLFYSSKEPQLVKRAKELFHNIGFGIFTSFKDRNTNSAKPLVISKKTDSWESIGLPTSTLEQIKMRHLSRISPEAEVPVTDVITTPRHTHPESVLDTKVALKYEELRSLPALDISIDDYLVGIK